MRDRFALPLIVLAAVAMVALALVWPQGQGKRSPAPFGHPVVTRSQNVTVGGHTTTIRGTQDIDDSLEAAAKGQ